MTDGALPARAVWLRRNRQRLLQASWPASLAVMGLWMLLRGDVTTGLVNITTGLTLWFAMLSSGWAKNEDPERQAVDLAIGDGQLRVGDHRFDVARVRAGYQLAGEPPRLRLHVGEQPLPIDLELGTAAEASAVLDALRLGPSQRVATFRAVAPTPKSAKEWLARLGPVLGLMGAFALTDASIMWVPVILSSLVFSLWRRQAHVGSDGVRVERGLWFDRFLPHDQIAQVRVIAARNQREGANVVLQTADDAQRVGFRTMEDAEAFAQRLRQAAAEAQRDDAPVAATLARGEDDVADWIARLQAAVQLGTLRAGAVTDGQLWRLLEGPAVRPVERAAAAIALGPRLDAPARKRVLDVAAATASPKLRVVLSAVGEEEDEGALAEAMAELVAQEEQTEEARVD